MVYGTYNELVTGAYKPTYNCGASHCSILPGLVYKKTMERSTIINGYIIYFYGPFSIAMLGIPPTRYAQYQESHSGIFRWVFEIHPMFSP